MNIDEDNVLVDRFDYEDFINYRDLMEKDSANMNIKFYDDEKF